MALVSEQFPSNYLKTEDIRANAALRAPLTIRVVEDEDIGGESKLVMYFRGVDKGLPLNRTNCETLAEILGDDTDDWRGGVITLIAERTQFRGKRVWGTRIDKVTPATDAAAAAAAADGQSPGQGKVPFE